MRRKKRVVITAEKSRDFGKAFMVTEMPAEQAERWAQRALLALTHAGAELPDYARNGGWAGLAMMGYQALFRLDTMEIEPLLAEMWDTFTACPDKTNPGLERPLVRGQGDNDDIEDVATILQLRLAWWEVHTGFSLPDAVKLLMLAIGQDPNGQSNTQTSPSQSEPSSQAASPQ